MSLRSCGVAERVGDAVQQRWSEFLHLWRDLGREETLFPPDLAADGGEGVGEGRAFLAIPSSRRDRQARLGAEACGQERDQGVVQNRLELGDTGARERRPLKAGFWLDRRSAGEVVSLPGSPSLGLKLSQAKQGQPVRMRLAGQQLARALAPALGVAAAQEAAVVEEEAQQVEVGTTEVPT